VSIRDNNGALVGLAPYYFAEFRFLRLIPYRTLRIMADYATGLDYPDWIIRKDCEVEISYAIADTLAGVSNRWDCIWMANVAGWTGARERILRTCREKGFFCHERPRDFSSFDLPEDMDAYMARLSRNRRSQVRRQVKKVLSRDGIHVVRCRTANDLPEFLNALFDLHHRRWKQRGEEGTFRRHPDQILFYQNFTKLAFEQGWLRLLGLKENDKFKAVQIGYVYKNIFNVLQDGFDPDFIPGVGNVLRFKVLETCIAEGISSYDLLGEMTEHKRRWGAKKRIGFDFIIGNKSLKNRLLFFKEIWPTGRFLVPENIPRAPNDSP